MNASSGQEPRQPWISKSLPQDRQRHASKPAAAGALEAVPAGQAAARFEDRLVGGQPAGDLAEVGRARRTGTFGLDWGFEVGEVPRVEPVKVREFVLGAVHHGCPAQITIDV